MKKMEVLRYLDLMGRGLMQIITEVGGGMVAVMGILVEMDTAGVGAAAVEEAEREVMTIVTELLILEGIRILAESIMIVEEETILITTGDILTGINNSVDQSGRH